MAERGKYYWLKLKEDFFDDKVIKYLRKLPEGPTLVIIYLKMQLKSLKAEGFLRYDGILPTCEEELALVLDESPMLVTGAINALVKMGVVERWENDVLYMKAMQEIIGSETAAAARVRKHRELKQMQENGAELLQCNASPLHCNTNVTQCNTEKREKREEIRDREKISDTDTDTDFTDDKRPTTTTTPQTHVSYEEIKSLFNDICKSYPKVQKMSEARKKTIKARFNEGYTMEDFKTLFENAEKSSFLKGQANSEWSANFDWLIKGTNIAKVIDGNYGDKQKPQAERIGDLDDLF